MESASKAGLGLIDAVAPTPPVEAVIFSNLGDVWVYERPSLQFSICLPNSMSYPKELSMSDLKSYIVPEIVVSPSTSCTHC